MARGSETIYVVRAQKIDRLKPPGQPPTRTPVDRCIVLPRASRENERGWVQISGFTIFAPPDADIHEDDRIEVRGELHSVEGKPGLLTKKNGRHVNLAVTTEQVS